MYWLYRVLCYRLGYENYIYSETWELGTPKGLPKTVLNSEVVLFLRSISMYWIGIGTEVALLNSQVVPISQVVLKTGFTVAGNYINKAAPFKFNVVGLTLTCCTPKEKLKLVAIG